MKRKKPSMIFMLTILLVCVALVASIVSVRINIDKKNQEINELNAKIQEKTDSNAALKDSVENSDIDGIFFSSVRRPRLYTILGTCVNEFFRVTIVIYQNLRKGLNCFQFFWGFFNRKSGNIVGEVPFFYIVGWHS